MSIYNGSHLDLSDPNVARNNHVLCCVIEDLRQDVLSTECLGTRICKTFQVNVICHGECAWRKCNNMSHPTGCSSQRLFWTRTPIGRHVLENANFENFRKTQQCCFKRCGHLRQHSQTLFCQSHTCLLCELNTRPVTSYQTRFYETVFVLEHLIPKDIIRCYIAPLLRAKVLPHAKKGHVVTCMDWKIQDNRPKLRGVCKGPCPLWRSECNLKVSSTCAGRTDGRFNECKQCQYFLTKI